MDSFNQLTISPFPGYNSLDELFQRAVDLYANTDCLGTRELLSDEDELQPSGKVFHKASITNTHTHAYPCLMASIAGWSG